MSDYSTTDASDSDEAISDKEISEDSFDDEMEKIREKAKATPGYYEAMKVANSISECIDYEDFKENCEDEFIEMFMLKDGPWSFSMPRQKSGIKNEIKQIRTITAT